ncbi:MAG: F0F1 ATP synthase subunit A [Bacteroidales bacterium]|nr:F0F1 ATP synthase subunit A [Bacteroidales bacterium]MBN2821225.1 F0F1 ATP synthase subunit A [Bacteroidales bacterium]
MTEGKAFRIIPVFVILLYILKPINASEEPKQNHQDHTEQQTDHYTDNSEHQTEEHNTHEAFEPGKFMFDHISDAYDWHIIDIGKKSVSIPLPIILYSSESGLNVFMSSKFHHGHASFRNFHIAAEGETVNHKEVKGKIIETLSDGTKVIPFDISFTKNIASLFIGIILILWIFISVGKAYQKKPIKAPSGLQSWVEPMIIFVRDEIAIPSIGIKKYEKFLPFLLTVFFFIWINNMLGLVPFFPGGANLTGNISVTLVLALFTFFITTISGNKTYWKHIFNTPGVPWWLKVPIPLMPFVEFLGVLTKPFVLMVRLFANITAGHIIALGFLSLVFLFGEMGKIQGYGISIVSVGFIIFMTFLELLVAFIQAYVFTFLSAIYFGMAVEEHH